MTSKRLFDCLDYQLENLPLETMLAGKENGVWTHYSTSMVKSIVNRFSAGLLSIGASTHDTSVEKRDKIAVISKNRPEWVMLDLAVQQIGVILVPVYPTMSDSELEFIFNDAQVKWIFVNDQASFEKIQSIRTKVPSVLDVYSFEKVDGAKHWKELLSEDSALLEAVKLSADKVKPDDLMTIIYTSGTTGTPKGVMLSHHNIMSDVESSKPCFPPIVNGFKALSFLPLNHIFERMITYLYLFNSTGIYYAESMETISDNLKEIKPHLFATVPRLLEKVYEKIIAKGNELSFIKKRIFFWAHHLATKFEINQKQNGWYKLQMKLADKLIFSKWREALGNQIVCIVTGGAACQLRLVRIFTAAKIPILEGYGLTETSPAIAVNSFVVPDRKFGSVGRPFQGVEVKIAEDGEILCKGPIVMKGYYKREDLTQVEITDGWFHTGDIGRIDEEGFLFITDRKKELFKTSGGKYVAPLAIENKLKESSFIEQAMIVGAGKKFVAALIVPSFVKLKQWCDTKGIPFTSNEGMVVHPKVIKKYKKEIAKFNMLFSHVEQIKEFSLLATEWTIESGELTPKLSLKRRVVLDKYAKEIDLVYKASEFHIEE
jgi:long-chain acyl-CoA synthetase